jgi:beta-lactamase regulating signal transducer with metallopeptidase domain
MTTAGWFVLHACWQGALIGGVAAAWLGASTSAAPDRRLRIAGVALLLMVMLPALSALLGADPLAVWDRRPLLAAADSVVPLPDYVLGRDRVVFALGVLWVCGAAWFAIRVAGAWRQVHVLARTSQLDQGVALALTSRLRRSMAVRTPVTVAWSDRVDGPMVFGARRATLLLPAPGREEASADDLNAIIAHELAHVRRRDYAANWALLAAEAACFFHPAARWLARRVRIEREFCCDRDAIAATGDAVRYARALAVLDDARPAGPLAMAAGAGTMVERIARIAGRRVSVLSRRASLLALGGGIAAAALLAAVVNVLPPRMPEGARLRTRSAAPPPAGPAADSLPRKQARQSD